MVVVSGSWVKNVVTYPTPAKDNDMVISTTNGKMSAKAILIARPNSHPFQERTLMLDQPVKVGRSVARARATPTNAIFDCKVLSRHHALLWYDAGKFYLQDTKSSNGTFVNNNRLSSSDSDPHELCSGDIVQFGVDVVENNPDGKEAKASPSITETSRHGLVPLDELYKLNQIIQEACQREQCLESKLLALQQVVEETRRSADESWQAYIGEERLLSRVATLENQLMQAAKNITDDRLREELNKFQEEKISYQSAAKEALRKLHVERLEAVTAATEQERAKTTAEQEAVLAKEQLVQVQQEIQEVAQKLVSEQNKSEEERVQLEQKERELQARLESESQTVHDLQSKLEQYKLLVNSLTKELLPLEELEKCSLIYTEGIKSKEELLGENETCENLEADNNNQTKIDEPEQNHINLRMPLLDDSDDTDMHMHSDVMSDDSEEMDSIIATTKAITVDYLRENTVIDSDGDNDDKEEIENEKEHMNEPEVAKNDQENLHVQNGNDERDSDSCEISNERGDTGRIESRTLKHQFQSLQCELKKQIDQLQQQSCLNSNKISELESALSDKKQECFVKSEECECLTQDLSLIKQKLIETSNENQKLTHTILCLNEQLSNTSSLSEHSIVNSNNAEELNLAISDNCVSMQQIVALEEELVLMKERYALVNEEKRTLNKNLVIMQDQYNALCNRSHNTIFLYIAPLVLTIIYLLISQHLS